jgi:hypothetical protein
MRANSKRHGIKRAVDQSNLPEIEILAELLREDARQ